MDKYKALKSNFYKPQKYTQKEEEKKKYNLQIKFENQINQDVFYKKQDLNIIMDNITLFEEKKNFKVKSYIITPSVSNL